MLVNTFADLQLIGSNNNTLGGTYALGKDINADNNAPIGSAGSPYHRPARRPRPHHQQCRDRTTAAGVSNIGLFGAIGATGTIRNLNLTDFWIKANPNAAGLASSSACLPARMPAPSATSTSATARAMVAICTGVIAGGLVRPERQFRSNNQQIAGSIRIQAQPG